MCLTPLKTRKFLWWTFPKIQRAKKNIIVYKILSFHNNPPFQKFLYERGCNYPMLFQNSKQIRKKSNVFVSITYGWLHAFTNEHAAERYIERMLLWPENYKICKMIIPRGTKYILGKEDDICAKCLRWD